MCQSSSGAVGTELRHHFLLDSLVLLFASLCLFPSIRAREGKARSSGRPGPKSSISVSRGRVFLDGRIEEDSGLAWPCWLASMWVSIRVDFRLCGL